ncbi:MAG: CHRD domain-containing protein [Sulfuricaulis sp.]
MKIFLWLLAWISIAVLAGCAYDGTQEASTILRLTGAQEVPPVSTAASGGGRITVLSDRSVTGSVTISGMTAKAAHIHEGAPGKAGPVIIPLTKTSGDTWSVPAGANLTASQYMAYLAGDLYVNVHSAAHPGGGVRGQITPPPPPPQPRPMMHYGY